jgi:hypothetical protein
MSEREWKSVIRAIAFETLVSVAMWTPWIAMAVYMIYEVTE